MYGFVFTGEDFYGSSFLMKKLSSPLLLFSSTILPCAMEWVMQEVGSPQMLSLKLLILLKQSRMIQDEITSWLYTWCLEEANAQAHLNIF